MITAENLIGLFFINLIRQKAIKPLLKILASNDTKWRQIALNICKDKTLADDIVQETYLRLANNPKAKEEFYVIITMRNLYLDHKKNLIKNKTVSINNFYDMEQPNETIELDDKQELQLKEKQEQIGQMYWLAREYIILNHTMSLRKMGEALNTNYAFIYRTIKQAKEKIKK